PVVVMEDHTEAVVYVRSLSKRNFVYAFIKETTLDRTVWNTT
ncbi:5759_t:CDS:1, partial [Ambispora leptoticha]